MFHNVEELEGMKFQTDKHIEFDSSVCHVYLNEILEGDLAVTPKGLNTSNLSLMYKDMDGNTHTLENVSFVYIQGGTSEEKELLSLCWFCEQGRHGECIDRDGYGYFEKDHERTCGCELDNGNCSSPGRSMAK